MFLLSNIVALMWKMHRNNIQAWQYTIFPSKIIGIIQQTRQKKEGKNSGLKMIISNQKQKPQYKHNNKTYKRTMDDKKKPIARKEPYARLWCICLVTYESNLKDL